ncbi:hypothetical protein FQN49_006632, partial [Arthroderma sp. PD_2]
ISLMDGETLGVETLNQSHIDSLPTDAELRRTFWREWLHQVVRYGVIGNTSPPTVHLVQSQCEEAPSLLSLVEEMEERQLRWHATRLPPDNPSCPRDRTLSQTTTDQKEPDFLCLRIAGNARQTIDQFAFDARDFENRK